MQQSAINVKTTSISSNYFSINDFFKTHLISNTSPKSFHEQHVKHKPHVPEEREFTLYFRDVVFTFKLVRFDIYACIICNTLRLVRHSPPQRYFDATVNAKTLLG